MRRVPFLSIPALLSAALLSACSSLPTIGPSSDEIQKSTTQPGEAAIQIVEVDDAVTRQLLAKRAQSQFADTLGNPQAVPQTVGAGDVIEVTVWEAPPATLFGGGIVDPRAPASARVTPFPEQTINQDGFINIPFAGQIKAAGMTPLQIETQIAERLKGKANQAQVLVRVVRNTTSNVTVVGEVGSSARVPLTPRGERLLDALAAVGGTKAPINKMTIQVTRGSNVFSMPLEAVIRDPKQNVTLQAGDVVTALFQPLSFTALGSTGKNEEINFEAQGITLAQALARSGGLIDSRSNPQGVFIFRFEPKDSLKWPRDPVAATPEGMVPVVYRIDLRNPGSFFVMQSFPMSNKDILYVSNAPAAELQKFLNLIVSVAYPVLTLIQVTK